MMMKIIRCVLAAGLLFMGVNAFGIDRWLVDTDGICNIHDEMSLINAPNTDLPANILHLALTAYNCARLEGYGKKDILTIVDFADPSTEKRMWVLDLKTGQILFFTHVAHGMGSGENYATKFSNQPGTHESSLGLFLTDYSYIGNDGYSMHLTGLEKGFNSDAYQREIVFHGANYVTPLFIKDHGRLGRSWGCFALNPKKISAVIQTIEGGSLVFAYYPEQKWLTESTFLHCQLPAKKTF